MNKSSTSLIHKFNNQFATILTSLEAMEANLDDKTYLKEILSEILKKKNDYQFTLDEVKSLIINKESQK